MASDAIERAYLGWDEAHGNNDARERVGFEAGYGAGWLAARKRAVEQIKAVAEHLGKISEAKHGIRGASSYIEGLADAYDLCSQYLEQHAATLERLGADEEA